MPEKSSSHFADSITPFRIGDLRDDLIELARKMVVCRQPAHAWRGLSHEEMLRSAGLLRPDPETKDEGVTIAAVLLFGKDGTIMSALPQYRTEATFHVRNTDRYDDRDVIVTNLLESYDRLFEFGRRHLSDPFVLDGIQAVSARDRILREIISNSLAHRDYSSPAAAKFVIEDTRLFTENASRPHARGRLSLTDFEPCAKNPTISRIFREIGLAGEPGSGMRSMRKFVPLYSGGTPEFIEEGDTFRTVIPLNAASVGIVGPRESGWRSAGPSEER